MKPGTAEVNQSSRTLSADSDLASGGIDYVQLALRFKWLIVAGAAVGLTMGHLAYLRMGPQYDASAQILVAKRESVMKSDEEAVTRTGERTEHIALIMSPMIVDRAVKNHKLDRLPTLATSSDPTDDILGGLTVKRSAGQDRSFLNVLDINYTSPRVEDARTIVNAVIEAYREYLSEAHRESTEEILDLIGQARKDLVAELQAKESEFFEFRQAAPLLWDAAPTADGQAAGSSDVHRETIRAIEQERHRLLVLKAELDSRRSNMRRALENQTSPETLDLMVRRFLQSDGAGSTQQSALQARFAQDEKLLPLLLQLAELERDFGPEHPEIIEINKQIETIREFYRQRGVESTFGKKDSPGEDSRILLAREYLRLLDQQLLELSDRETNLQQQLLAETKAAKEFAVYHERDRSFREEIARLKSLLESVETRAKTSKLEKDNLGYEMKLLSPVRDELVFKRHLKFLIGGIGMGVALAGLFAIWRELRDTTVKSADELRRRISLPLIGCIPESARLSETRSLPGTPLSGSLCYFHLPESMEAEAYRSVRTALSIQAGSRRVLQVTSPESGDGKSTFISNMAIAMAQLSKKVLLVDADLRRPTIHRLFGASHPIGLSDVLNGDIEFENAVQETLIPNLYLLTAGAIPTNPSELLSGPRFHRMLDQAREDFDLILFDTPPLLAVSDPCVVGAQTDGVILVVRIGKNTRTAVIRAHELLDAHSIETLGIAANGLDYQLQYSDPYAGREDSETRDSKSTGRSKSKQKAAVS